ncbi:MAG: oxygen-dependent coproporphyrinogen oxidase [Balneolaceae bacterium]
MTRLRDRFSKAVITMQEEICRELESVDGGARFREDNWDRPGGGGGRTRILTNGDLIEQGGVNVSSVFGHLPESIRQSVGANAGWFHASGLSIVLHPMSPMVPTMHANIRYFELYEDEGLNHPVDAWFGGGADLTPWYLRERDAVHFHETLRNACADLGPDCYARFKSECDRYFFNHHRGEARGVGGIFFDHLRSGDPWPEEDLYRFTTGLGNRLMNSWVPIAERRREEPWGEEQRWWQEVRRGRYVEFNLIHDRGTLFGLRTGGRTESILMSLPPRVRWVYNHEPVTGTPEAKLTECLRNPVDWMEIGRQRGWIQDAKQDAKSKNSGGEE